VSQPNPCATCAACCRSYVVPLDGYDVWRISHGQRLDPADFCVALARDAEQPGTFRLTADGPTFILMLEKQGKLEVNRPCVFLMHLDGGHARCGIYEQRPSACRAYPMEMKPEGMALLDRRLCPPDSWPEDEPRKRPWRHAVLRANLQWVVYAEVVARWNARVAASPHLSFALGEYYSYLLNVYERLAAFEASLEPAGLARIELTWGYQPGPERPDLSLSDLAWPRYLRDVRAMIDEFYPEIPLQELPEPIRELWASSSGAR
jgi:Fe-S-cluster containining protein